MPEQELNLLQFSSGEMTQARATPAKIMGSEVRDSSQQCRSLHNMPNCSGRDVLPPPTPRDQYGARSQQVRSRKAVLGESRNAPPEMPTKRFDWCKYLSAKSRLRQILRGNGGQWAGQRSIIIGGEVLMLPPEIAKIVKLAGPKNRQHYVFQRYLKAWERDRKVWVRRHREKKVFHATTRNVAVENHFYKLQPVTEEDLALIRLLLLDTAPDYVKERCETLIHNMTVPMAIKMAIDPANPGLKEISAWLDEHIINAQENLHCDVEEGLVPAIDSMLDGKIEFYRENDSAQEFIHAICFQYMRTKKMREGMEAIGPTPVPGSDMKRCSTLYMLISTMRFADSLYRRRDQFKIVLLDNETAIPFITGDQPIINVHATGSEAPPERLELFYPLSPKRAMTLLELATERSTALSINEVQQFNELILWNSYEQVFSNSREYLDGLRMDGSSEL